MSKRWRRVVFIGRLSAVARLALVASLAGLAIGPVTAHATSGEIARIGQFGEGEGEFHFAGPLAVDSETNDVFVVDEPHVKRPRSTEEYRVQEFPPGLAKAIAAATISTPSISTMKGNEDYRFIAGEAVDASLHRLYLLVGIGTEASAAPIVAKEILVYSTVASSKTLTLESAVKSATGKAGVAYEFPTMPEGENPVVPANSLLSPEQIAVDPSNHELVVLGQETSFNAQVQRIGFATETPQEYKKGASLPTLSYDDTGHNLSHEARAELPTGLSVGPDGSVYISVKSNHTESSEKPAVVKATPNFSSLTTVTHGAGTPGLTGGSEGGEGGRSYGPQIAVSPEASGPYAGVVYAFEATKRQAAGTPPVAGNYEIRGMSTTTGLQELVFGGEEWKSRATPCAIASDSNAVAAGSGGVVYALDEGTIYEESEVLPSAFGYDLVEFGPGGEHCPAPATSVKVNGDEASPIVKVQKGQEVKLEATSTGLHGEEPTELVWEYEGPGKTETKTEEFKGAPAALSATHKFLKPGLYTVTLKMTVSPGSLGSPPAVVRNLEVTAPPPTASFEASTMAPKSGETVTFNAAASVDPTGSASGGPVHTLKSYTWSFGDGSSPVTTSSAEVTHAFANATSEAEQETVTLTVTNEEEVQSAPTSEVLTVGATPAGGGGGGGGTSTTPPPTPTIVGPVPPPIPRVIAKKPLTNAQKLAIALKACKKDKSRKARASCERRAKAKYATKKKQVKKK